MRRTTKINSEHLIAKLGDTTYPDDIVAVCKTSNCAAAAAGAGLFHARGNATSVLNTAELMETVLKAEVTNNDEFHVVREGEAGRRSQWG